MDEIGEEGVMAMDLICEDLRHVVASVAVESSVGSVAAQILSNPGKLENSRPKTR